MTHPTPQKTTKPQKPWYKKWWGITAIVVLAFGALGAIMDLTASPIKVPDTVGKPAAQAQADLKEAGFATVKLVKPDGSALISPNDDWEVTASEPAVGSEVKPSQEIVLTASDERVQAEKQAAQEAAAKAAEEARQSSLSPSAAQAFCEKYAQQLSDEKLKFHWWGGKLAEDAREDGTIFFKVKVTGKNAAGAKREYEVECHVGGTTEAPEMLEFNSY